MTKISLAEVKVEVQVKVHTSFQYFFPITPFGAKQTSAAHCEGFDSSLKPGS